MVCLTFEPCTTQALKAAKNNLKKLTKNLSKEKDRLVELEAVPEKMDKEIKELEKKICVLENRKNEEEQKLSAVMESEFIIWALN